MEHSSTRRWRPWLARLQGDRGLLTMLVGIGAFFWLNHIDVGASITSDSVRDFLYQRDCIELGQCHLIGAKASVPGFAQGALWPDFLIALRLLGGDATSARLAVLALLSTGVATVFLVSWTWVSAVVALPAALFSIAALGGYPIAEVLVNPCAAFFPNVICAAALLIFGLTEEYRFLMVAAFMLSIAIDTHVAALSLVPAVLFAACLYGRRPWLALSLASASGLATSLLTSRAALLANFMGLVEHRERFAGFFAGVGLAVAIGFVLRRFEGSRRNRATIIGAALVCPFGLGAIWLLTHETQQFSLTYLPPVAGPLSVMAAATLAWPLRRWSSSDRTLKRGLSYALPIIGALGALATTNTRSGSSQAWTLPDAGRLATYLEARHWSYPQVAFHIQGEGCNQLLEGLAVYMPRPTTAPVDPHRTVVISRKASSDQAASGTEVVPLEHGMNATVREFESWLDPSRTRECRHGVEGDAATFCEKVVSKETVSQEDFLFSERMVPRMPWFGVRTPYVDSFELWVDPHAEQSREFSLPDHESSDCAWHFVGMNGIEPEEELPATHVRVRSRNGQSGQLFVERLVGGHCAMSDSPGPPCLLESSEPPPSVAGTHR